MRVRNVSRNVVLVDSLTIADTGAKRRTGLLKHDSFAHGQGMWIVPCEAVHTWGMPFAIDVLFLNRRRQIIKVRTHMGRRRIAICLRAHSVLELPAGMVELTNTHTGDQLEFSDDDGAIGAR